MKYVGKVELLALANWHTKTLAFYDQLWAVKSKNRNVWKRVEITFADAEAVGG